MYTNLYVKLMSIVVDFSKYNKRFMKSKQY